MDEKRFDLEDKPRASSMLDDEIRRLKEQNTYDDSVKTAQEEAAEAFVLNVTPQEAGPLERKQVITDDIAKQFHTIKQEFGSYTNYYKQNNNQHFPGYEAIGAEYLNKEHKDREYAEYVETGIITEEEFLRKHYVGDILKDAGHNVTSRAYWYNKLMSGDGTSPLTNKYTMHKAYEVARGMYEAQSIAQAHKRAQEGTLELSAESLFGEKITGEDFARLFGVPEGSDPDELLRSYKQLGYIATEMEEAIAPILQDADGTVYGYLHRSGVLYSVGEDDEAYRAMYDEANNVQYLRAQGGEIRGGLVTFADSLLAGAVNFVGTLGQIIGTGVWGIGSLAVEAADKEKSLGEGFMNAYSVIEAFKHGEDLHRLTSSKFVDLSGEWNAMRVADGIAGLVGTVAGMKATFGASAALNAASRGAIAAGKGAGVKHLAWSGAQKASNVTMKMTGIYSGRWGGVSPSQVMNNPQMMGLQTAKGALAKKGGVATAKSATELLTQVRTASAKNHVALISTYGAKDFIDNAGYMLMRADLDDSFAATFGDTEEEQRSEIYRRAAGVAIFNMGVSAIFTGGIDDSPSRRMALFAGGRAQTDKAATKILSKYVSGERWRLFADFGADSIDNIVTMTLNQAVKQEGEGSPEAFIRSLNPHTIGMGLYMAGVTAKGSQRFALEAGGATLGRTKKEIDNYIDGRINSAKTPEERSSFNTIKQELQKTYQDVLSGKEVTIGSDTFKHVDDKGEPIKDMTIHASIAYVRQAETLFRAEEMRGFVNKGLDDVRLAVFRELDETTTRNLLAVERDLATMTKGILGEGAKPYFREMFKNIASGGTRTSNRKMISNIQNTLKISNEAVFSAAFGDITRDVTPTDLGKALDAGDTQRLTNGMEGVRLNTDIPEGELLATVIKHLFPEADVRVEVLEDKTYLGVADYSLHARADILNRVRDIALEVNSLRGATPELDLRKTLQSMYERRYGEDATSKSPIDARAANMRDLIQALVDSKLLTIDQAAELFGAAAAEGETKRLFQHEYLKNMTAGEKDIKLKDIKEANETLRLVNQFVHKNVGAKEVPESEIKAAKATLGQLYDNDGTLKPAVRHILNDKPQLEDFLLDMQKMIKEAELDPRVLPQLLNRLLATSSASYKEDPEITKTIGKFFTTEDPDSILRQVTANDDWEVNNVYIDVGSFSTKLMNNLHRGLLDYLSTPDNINKTVTDYLNTSDVKADTLGAKQLVMLDYIKQGLNASGTPYLKFTKDEAEGFARNMGYRSLADMNKHTGVFYYASSPFSIDVKLDRDSRIALDVQKHKIVTTDATPDELAKQLSNGVINLSGDDVINITRISGDVLTARSVDARGLEAEGLKTERTAFKSAIVAGKKGESDTMIVLNSPRYNVDFEDASYYKGTQLFDMLDKLNEGSVVSTFKDDVSFYKETIKKQLGKKTLGPKGIEKYFGADSPWDATVDSETITFKFNRAKYDKIKKSFNAGELNKTNIFKFLPSDLTEREVGKDYGNQAGYQIGSVPAIRSTILDFTKLITNWYDTTNNKVTGYKDITISNKKFVRDPEVFNNIKTMGVKVDDLIAELKSKLMVDKKRNAYVQDMLNRLEIAKAPKEYTNKLSDRVNKLLASQTIIDMLLKEDISDSLVKKINNMQAPKGSVSKELEEDKNIINIEDGEYQAAAQIFRNVELHPTIKDVTLKELQAAKDYLTNNKETHNKVESIDVGIGGLAIFKFGNSLKIPIEKLAKLTDEELTFLRELDPDIDKKRKEIIKEFYNITDEDLLKPSGAAPKLLDFTQVSKAQSFWKGFGHPEQIKQWAENHFNNKIFINKAKHYLFHNLNNTKMGENFDKDIFETMWKGLINLSDEFKHVINPKAIRSYNLDTEAGQKMFINHVGMTMKTLKDLINESMSLDDTGRVKRSAEDTDIFMDNLLKSAVTIVLNNKGGASYNQTKNAFLIDTVGTNAGKIILHSRNDSDFNAKIIMTKAEDLDGKILLSPKAGTYERFSVPEFGVHKINHGEGRLIKKRIEDVEMLGVLKRTTKDEFNKLSKPAIIARALEMPRTRESAVERVREAAHELGMSDKAFDKLMTSVSDIQEQFLDTSLRKVLIDRKIDETLPQAKSKHLKEIIDIFEFGIMSEDRKQYQSSFDAAPFKVFTTPDDVDYSFVIRDSKGTITSKIESRVMAVVDKLLDTKDKINIKEFEDGLKEEFGKNMYIAKEEGGKITPIPLDSSELKEIYKDMYTRAIVGNIIKPRGDKTEAFVISKMLDDSTNFSKQRKAKLPIENLEEYYSIDVETVLGKKFQIGTYREDDIRRVSASMKEFSDAEIKDLTDLVTKEVNIKKEIVARLNDPFLKKAYKDGVLDKEYEAWESALRSALLDKKKADFDPEILRIIKDEKLLGYNIKGFDADYLGVKWDDTKHFDLEDFAKQNLIGEKKLSLGALVKRFDVPTEDARAHDAGYDAEMVKRLIPYITKSLKESDVSLINNKFYNYIDDVSKKVGLPAKQIRDMILDYKKNSFNKTKTDASGKQSLPVPPHKYKAQNPYFTQILNRYLDLERKYTHTKTLRDIHNLTYNKTSDTLRQHIRQGGAKMYTQMFNYLASLSDNMLMGDNPIISSILKQAFVNPQSFGKEQWEDYLNPKNYLDFEKLSAALKKHNINKSAEEIKKEYHKASPVVDEKIKGILEGKGFNELEDIRETFMNSNANYLLTRTAEVVTALSNKLKLDARVANELFNRAISLYDKTIDDAGYTQGLHSMDALTKEFMDTIQNRLGKLKVKASYNLWGEAETKEVFGKMRDNKDLQADEIRLPKDVADKLNFQEIVDDMGNTHKVVLLTIDPAVIAGGSAIVLKAIVDPKTKYVQAHPNMAKQLQRDFDGDSVRLIANGDTKMAQFMYEIYRASNSALKRIEGTYRQLDKFITPKYKKDFVDADIDHIYKTVDVVSKDEWNKAHQANLNKINNIETIEGRRVEIEKIKSQDMYIVDDKNIFDEYTQVINATGKTFNKNPFSKLTEADIKNRNVNIALSKVAKQNHDSFTQHVGYLNKMHMPFNESVDKPLMSLYRKTLVLSDVETAQLKMAYHKAIESGKFDELEGIITKGYELTEDRKYFENFKDIATIKADIENKTFDGVDDFINAYHRGMQSYDEMLKANDTFNKKIVDAYAAYIKDNEDTLLHKEITNLSNAIKDLMEVNAHMHPDFLATKTTNPGYAVQFLSHALNLYDDRYNPLTGRTLKQVHSEYTKGLEKPARVLYVDMAKFGFTEDAMFMRSTFFNNHHMFKGHYHEVDPEWGSTNIKKGKLKTYVNIKGKEVKIPETRGDIDIIEKNGRYYINYAEADRSEIYKTAGIKTLGSVAPKGSLVEKLLINNKADIIRDIKLFDKKKGHVTNIKHEGQAEKGFITTEPTMFTVGNKTDRDKQHYGLSSNNFIQSFADGLEGLLLGKHFYRLNDTGDGLVKDNRDFVDMVNNIRDLTTRPSGSTSNAIGELDLLKLLYLSDLHEKVFGFRPENGDPENLMSLQGLGTRTSAGYIKKLSDTITQDKSLDTLLEEHYGDDPIVKRLFSPQVTDKIIKNTVGQSTIAEPDGAISKSTKLVDQTEGTLKSGQHFSDEDTSPRGVYPKTSFLEDVLGVKNYGNYKDDALRNIIPSNSLHRGTMTDGFIAAVDRRLPDPQQRDMYNIIAADEKAGREASINALTKNMNTEGAKRSIPVGDPDGFTKTRTDSLDYANYVGDKNTKKLFVGYGGIKGQAALYDLARQEGDWSKDDMSIERHFRPEADEYMNNFKSTTQVLDAEITKDGLNFKYNTEAEEPQRVEQLLSATKSKAFSARLFDELDQQKLAEFFVSDEIPSILRTPGDSLYQKVSAYLKANPLENMSDTMYKTKSEIWKTKLAIADTITTKEGETKYHIFKGNASLLEDDVKSNRALLTSSGLDEKSATSMKAGRVITMAQDAGNKFTDRAINLNIKLQMLVQSLEGKEDFVKYMKASWVESQRKGLQPLGEDAKAVMNSLGFKTYDEMKTWAKGFDANHKDLVNTYIAYTKEIIAHATELQRLQGEDFNSFLMIAPFRGAKENVKNKARATIKQGFKLWNKPEDLLFDHTIDDFFEATKSILSNIKKGYISEAFKAGLKSEGLLDNEKILNALLLKEDDFDSLIKEHVKTLSSVDSKALKDQLDQIASLIKTTDKSALLQARHSNIITTEHLTAVYKTIMQELDTLSRYSDLSEDDIKLNLSDPELKLGAEKLEATRALELKTQLAGFVGDIAKENPKIAEALFTKLSSAAASAGKHGALVDANGRPITERGAFGRLRPDSSEFIKQELKYKGENSLLFKINVIREAVKGNVYVGHGQLGKILNEEIYTKQTHAWLETLRKGGKTTQGLIMMNLLKLPIRMFSFSAFDIAMISTVDPKAVLKIPTTVRLLKAYYQSDGQYSTPELDAYFVQKGFDSLTARQRDVIVGEADAFSNMSPLAAPYRGMKDLSRYALDIQSDFGRLALYLSLRDRFDDATKNDFYGPAYYNKAQVDILKDMTPEEAERMGFKNKQGKLVTPKAADRKAYYIVEQLLGSPGNFPKIAKDLSGLLVFNTFPLAITRATKGYTSSILKSVGDSFKGDTRGLFQNTAPLGLGLAGTWLMYELIMNFIESLYGMEEDDVEDIKSKMLTPDPIGTLLLNTPTFNYNSFHPLMIMDEMLTRPIRDAMNQEDPDIPKSVDALIRLLNSNAISRANPFLKIPVEVLAQKDLFGSDIIDTKHSYNMFENTVRKVAGIPLGMGMSRALVEGYQLQKYNDNTAMQNILSSVESGIKNELNASRAYNKSRQNYYKGRGMISNYRATMREETEASWEAADLYNGEIKTNRFNSGYDREEYKVARGVLNKLIRQERPMSEIDAAILDLIDPYGKYKLSPDSVQAVINTLSLQARFEGLKDPDHFLSTLTDTERRQFEEGLLWEQQNFPLLSEISIGGNEPYKRTPYLNRHYGGYSNRYSGAGRVPYIKKGYYRSPYRDLERGEWNQVKVIGPSDKMGIWEK